MKSIHVLLLFLAALPGVSWSMGRMTWFEAQEICRKKNQSLTLSTNISLERFYWTGVYNRTSHWIKILGCYNASSMQFKNDIKLPVSSPPLCQEYCLQNNMLDFAVQGKSCVCLSSGFEDSKRLHSSNCTYACDGDLLMSSECGGESAVNVFSTDTSILKIKSHCLSLQCGKDSKLVDTKCESSLSTICSDRKIVSSSFNPNDPTCTTDNVKWRCGMDRCKSNGVYLIGKMNLTDISSVCKGYTNTPRWIGVVKEIYSTFDQGKIITESETILKSCQQCRNGENGIDCRFIECKKKLNSDAQCSEVKQLNTTPPEITANTTTIPERKTRTIYPQPDGTDSTATLFETSGRSTQLPSSPHKNTEYPDTSARAVLSDQDSAIRTVIPLVVVIVFLGCCAVAGVFYLRRRKNKQKRVKNVGHVLTMDDENYTNIESHSVQNNLILQHSNPEYQLADNLILVSESPYNETEDGTYDHLGDKKARKRSVEVIYNHASSTELPDLSVYDSANRKRLSEEDNDYDHAGVANSTYGQYNSPQIRESDYSDLS